jgi:hypothetical protein
MAAQVVEEVLLEIDGPSRKHRAQRGPHPLDHRRVWREGLHGLGRREMMQRLRHRERLAIHLATWKAGHGR